MNIWHDIDPARISGEEFVAVIEIPRGGKNKYELDKETGLLKLDRVLFTSMQYPANYGFIPLTYAEDNDPLDVLVLCSENIAPLTLVNCRAIGVLMMTDQGEVDEKIIAVCVDDPFYNTYMDIYEIPEHVSAEIRHFYEVYKMLENKETSVRNVEHQNSAKAIIEKCIKRYREKFGS